MIRKPIIAAVAALALAAPAGALAAQPASHASSVAATSSRSFDSSRHEAQGREHPDLTQRQDRSVDRSSPDRSSLDHGAVHGDG